jgi:hypothetical protein
MTLVVFAVVCGVLGTFLDDPALRCGYLVTMGVLYAVIVS